MENSRLENDELSQSTLQKTQMQVVETPKVGDYSAQMQMESGQAFERKNGLRNRNI